MIVKTKLKLSLENKIIPLIASVFARPVFYPIHKLLFHLSLRGMGILNCSDRSSGEYYFIKHKLALLITNKSPIFVDVGANIGEYAKRLINEFPNSNIYAFEPHPLNFMRLKQSIGHAASCFSSALGACTEEIDLFDRADDDGSEHASVLKDVITDLRGKDFVSHKVKSTTLDSFTKANNITFIDFLKIDTEGYEFDVLVGARELISEQRVGVIQFEFNDAARVSRHFIDDFKHLLPNHILYRLLPKHLLRLDFQPIEEELFAFQNIVAIPKKLVPVV